MRKVLLVVIMIFACDKLPAQERDSTYKYWITVGGMIGKDMSLPISYSFSLRDYFLKVGYLVGGGILGGFGDNGYQYNSVAISIGKRLQSTWFQAALFGGPSYLFGERRIDPGNTEHYYTAGLQTDLQLLFRLANEVGVGFGLYGNLNFASSFAGINVNITIGNGK